MNVTKLQATERRRIRTRARVRGTAERPRLQVRISNRHIVAQLIDDTQGKTLLQVSTVGDATAQGTMIAKATHVGERIAAVATKQQIKAVVFDRGGKLYHGRLHALATAARAKGLEF